MSDDPNPSAQTPVPLFPLPNVVLLPTAVLPLHIFEERYKLMTADAVTGSRRVAMALLKPGWELDYRSEPAIEPVVCVGEIVRHERLPDGRYNFILTGIGRATVGREVKGKPYRRAILKPIAEVKAMEIDLELDRRHLCEVLDRGELARSELARQCKALCDSSLTTPQLADVIAFSLLSDVRAKQHLLAEGDQRTRVAATVRLLREQYPTQAAWTRNAAGLN